MPADINRYIKRCAARDYHQASFLSIDMKGATVSLVKDIALVYCIIIFLYTEESCQWTKIEHCNLPIRYDDTIVEMEVVKSVSWTTI